MGTIALWASLEAEMPASGIRQIGFMLGVKDKLQSFLVVVALAAKDYRKEGLLQVITAREV